jgi:hypothetical protein
MDAAAFRMNGVEGARSQQVQTGANGEVNAGPTGNPWIDSNGYCNTGSHGLWSRISRGMALDIDRQAADKDASELATEVHGKLGRRNDFFRLWNGSSLNGYLTTSADGRSVLLQLINYAATVPGQAVTAGIMGTYRSARIYTLDRPDGSPIGLRRVRDGGKVYLPPFPVYGAIELMR